MIGAAGDRDKEVEMWVICFARLEQQQAEISVVGFHAESFGFLDNFFGNVGDVHKNYMGVLTFAKKNIVALPLRWFSTICSQVCPEEGGLNLNSLPGEDMSAISRQKRLLIASKEWNPCQHIERAKQKSQKQGNKKVRNRK